MYFQKQLDIKGKPCIAIHTIIHSLRVKWVPVSLLFFSVSAT